MQTLRYLVRDIATTSPDVDVATAAKLMRNHHVGFLVVTDRRDGRQYPVGVISDRDVVLKAVARDIDPRSLKVSDVMTAGPLVAKADEDLEDLMARMRENGVRRAPVIDSDGALVGVVSFDDVLQTLARMLGNMASSVVNQRVAEIETQAHA